MDAARRAAASFQASSILAQMLAGLSSEWVAINDLVTSAVLRGTPHESVMIHAEVTMKTGEAFIVSVCPIHCEVERGNAYRCNPDESAGLA